MRSLLIPGDYIEYGTFTSTINLEAVKNRCAAYIKVTGAGTLNVRMGGSGGNIRPLTVTDGEELYGDFLAITSVTGVTRVRVGWT